jgi:chorismate mutase
MITKGIRGAITVDDNSAKAIENAVVKLLQVMIKENDIDKNKISHAIFTTTTDLNADFPAKYARINLGWDDVAMMCFHELDVPESLKMCLRILIVYNCEENFKPKFIYLQGAANLRK